MNLLSKCFENFIIIFLEFNIVIKPIHNVLKNECSYNFFNKIMFTLKILIDNLDSNINLKYSTILIDITEISNVFFARLS